MGFMQKTWKYILSVKGENEDLRFPLCEYWKQVKLRLSKITEKVGWKQVKLSLSKLQKKLVFSSFFFSIVLRFCLFVFVVFVLFCLSDFLFLFLFVFCLFFLFQADPLTSEKGPGQERKHDSAKKLEVWLGNVHKTGGERTLPVTFVDSFMSKSRQEARVWMLGCNTMLHVPSLKRGSKNVWQRMLVLILNSFQNPELRTIHTFGFVFFEADRNKQQKKSVFHETWKYAHSKILSCDEVPQRVSPRLCCSCPFCLKFDPGQPTPIRDPTDQVPPENIKKMSMGLALIWTAAHSACSFHLVYHTKPQTTPLRLT